MPVCRFCKQEVTETNEYLTYDGHEMCQALYWERWDSPPACAVIMRQRWRDEGRDLPEDENDMDSQDLPFSLGERKSSRKEQLKQFRPKLLAACGG